MARLIWLTGPSGSGKDSLLDALRTQPPAGLVIAHRYITRPASAGGENHVALTTTEFRRRLQAGLFALHWQAHGCEYGLGIEMDLWLQRGLNVLVNGSRQHCATARERYGDSLFPVVLQVSSDVLARRLRLRGREDEAAIALRLQRSVCVPEPNAVYLNNDGALADTLAAFNQLLENHALCNSPF
ncbi:ribose 1,5-bisphosphokinase [Mangrovibacter plantisponsor]|uniref:Ribose 1,5-bisphosphate phosphokinase PhnN n=1 Tax=Mangrovibacter plantisponsor TaxID=451513 RepID=A0A317PWI5_9ENTR|nr:ribose 1,5-bisphosphokinase [Mangrovibacter plantisponsor]PWW07038.1 ribose 1,5-bisphosphokinase [Mangrovibacter plantisponsor]